MIVKELPKRQEYLLFSEIDKYKNKSIFFARDGKLQGFILCNNNTYWLRTSIANILGGSFNTIQDAIEYGISYGYSFYVDVEV